MKTFFTFSKAGDRATVSSRRHTRSPLFRQASSVLFLAAAFFAVPTKSSGQVSAAANQTNHFQHIDSRQVADLEKKIQQVYSKVAPAVVRIFPDEAHPNAWFSGVIVSSAGEIFTCAHYDLPPQTKVIVELADGRRVKATTLGYFKKPASNWRYRPRSHDVGMLRLDEKGPWPAAALGRSDDLGKGDFCIAIGNPYSHGRGQPPLLRLGRIISPSADGAIRTSCRTIRGDSGSPLVDMEGRIIGVLSGHGGLKWADSGYASTEKFIEYRDLLRAGEEMMVERERPKGPIVPSTKDEWGAFQATDELNSAVTAAHRSTVEILGDGRPIALGLVVGADGWIITKRTELSGCERIGCRLADGRSFEACIAGSSTQHDLALLKVEAAGLPVAPWAKANALQVGGIVASLGPNSRTPHFGTVGATRVLNPATKGFLPINGQPTTPQGLNGHVFSTVWDRPDTGNLGELLQPGDLITHVDDTATPTPQKYVELRDRRLAAPDAFIGERIKLTVRRGEETMPVYVPIVQSMGVSSFDWKQCPRSLRRNGFPNVFSHDGGIAPAQCGGPVVDRFGRVLGINIARADEVQTFAIPGEVVQAVIAELKSNAMKD